MHIFLLVTLLTVGSFIAIKDLKYREISNRSIVTLLVLTLIGYSYSPHLLPKAGLTFLLALTMCIPIGALKSGIGGGDIKLIAILALLLGTPLRFTVAMFFATFIAGAMYLLKKFKSFRGGISPNGIAFAPALIFAALISL